MATEKDSAPSVGRETVVCGWPTCKEYNIKKVIRMPHVGNGVFLQHCGSVCGECGHTMKDARTWPL